MDPTTTTTIPTTTQGCPCSTQEMMIITAIIVAVILALKAFFRGTQYTGPRPDLTGKYAVVTGGNSGIGAETVRDLTKLGCEVIIGARSRETAQEVIKSIRKENPKAKVEFISLDLASRSSIDTFANSIPFPKIDYLVNNAGMMALPQRRTTKEGFQMQWGVNHLGHFYLTSLLWNKLKASDKFRIINVSSLAHRRVMGFGGEPIPDWDNVNFDKDYQANISYSRSKLYNVMFTQTLAERIGDKGITASLHPGVVRTQLMRDIKADGFKGKIVSILMILAYPLWWLVSKSAVQGSQTTLYTLLADDVENGEFYADCKKARKNSHATKAHADKLWQISEQKLGIKFPN